MTTTRELLEGAAKAAGIEIAHDDGKTLWVDFRGVGLRAWNPLNDDGDALRLACTLGMLVDINNPWFRTSVTYGHGNELFETHANGTACATRLAIVRAAYEISKGM